LSGASAVSWKKVNVHRSFVDDGRVDVAMAVWERDFALDTGWIAVFTLATVSHDTWKSPPHRFHDTFSATPHFLTLILCSG
jgi:hypothetical protein